MNTITLQLNERQLADLIELMDEGLDSIHSKLDKGQAEHYSQADREEIMRLCGEGVSEIRQAIEDRSYLWSSSSGCIELEIPAGAVEDIARPGEALPAVQHWLEKPSYLRAQFNRWESDDVQAARDYISEAGVEGYEDKTEEEVFQFILWMACNDVSEERHQED